MARLSKKDWIEEGYKILSEFAQDKLKILYLCQRLKVTRGSFYHHFKSIDDFIQELMKNWEEENTLKLIRISNKNDHPVIKMKTLASEIAKSNQSLEASIRSWSYYHPIVKQHMEKVDMIRLNYVQAVFEDLGFEKEKASKKAFLNYATLIGMQQLNPKLRAEEMEELFELYNEPDIPEHIVKELESMKL